MALNVGDRLGHYDVTALIGEGGMGQVRQQDVVSLPCDQGAGAYTLPLELS